MTTDRRTAAPFAPEERRGTGSPHLSVGLAARCAIVVLLRKGREGQVSCRRSPLDDKMRDVRPIGRGTLIALVASAASECYRRVVAASAIVIRSPRFGARRNPRCRILTVLASIGTMSTRAMDVWMRAHAGPLHEPTAKQVRVAHVGQAIVDTERALLVWEPRRIVPSYAVPVDDLLAAAGPGHCRVPRTTAARSCHRAPRSPCTPCRVSP